jgi:hypothetical protein
VPVKKIDTTGLTHLVFSFATIDPKTFAVDAMHPDDETLYKDFLALKDGSQKWIGIGKSPSMNCCRVSMLTSTRRVGVLRRRFHNTHMVPDGKL